VEVGRVDWHVDLEEKDEWRSNQARPADPPQEMYKRITEGEIGYSAILLSTEVEPLGRVTKEAVTTMSKKI